MHRTSLINPHLLAERLPCLMDSLKESLNDSDGAIDEGELRYLLLLKLDGFCARHFQDCECIE